MISAGKEEASDAIPSSEIGYGTAGAQGKAKAEVQQLAWTRIFSQCFVAMFLAEWGDRTQIAMIGQHASQPLIPVCLGSLAAFFLLTCLSAYLVLPRLRHARLPKP